MDKSAVQRYRHGDTSQGFAEHDLVKMLVQGNYLFKGLDEAWGGYLRPSY